MKKALLSIFFTVNIFANFTFFVGTDPHYGKSELTNDEAANKKTIYDMNALSKDFLYPDGSKIDEPKAVIVTGDLTDMGYYWQWYGLSLYFRFLQWDGFISDYGLNGENLLNYPVFEGFGNHDNLGWVAWVKNSIFYRNQQRGEKINLSENKLHYSWDWEGVHFIHLNVYPGDTKEAENSLTFLKYDLENNLADKSMPLILFHHFGFDGYSDDWWTCEERENYFNVINNYNTVAIFQGHEHSMFHLVWKGIDVFSPGSLKDIEYFVCRVEDNKLKINARENCKWTSFYFEKDLVK